MLKQNKLISNPPNFRRSKGTQYASALITMLTRQTFGICQFLQQRFFQLSQLNLQIFFSFQQFCLANF